MKGWIKKLVTGLSAVAMTVGMMDGSSVPAFASASDPVYTGIYSEDQKAYTWEADNGPFTLTIDNAHEGHTYEVYQIFKGDVLKGTKKTFADDDETKPSTYDSLPDTAWMMTNIQTGSNLEGDITEGSTTQTRLEALANELSCADSGVFSNASSFQNLANKSRPITAADLAEAISGYREDYNQEENPDLPPTSTFLSDPSTAELLAQTIAKYLTGTPKYTMSKPTNSEKTTWKHKYSTEVEGGYYLIIDKDGTQTNPKSGETGTDSKNSAYTYILLQVAGNATVEPKEGVPTVEKKVWSENDKLSITGESGTTTSSGTWADWATYGNSGTDSDKIYFKITGTLPDQIENREQNSDFGDQYWQFTTYTFTDTFAPGISPTTTTTDGNTALSDLKVWYSPTDRDDNSDDLKEKTVKQTETEGSYNFYDMTDLFHVEYTAAVAPTTENGAGTNGKIVVSLKKDVDLAGIFKYDHGKVVQATDDQDPEITYLSKDGKIIVTYTAQLNDHAVVGQNGNLNTVNLTYTNNPNDGKNSNTGVTPDDKVSVLTFKVQPTKYKEAEKKGNELANAVFTIFGDKATTSAGGTSHAIDTNTVFGQGVSAASTGLVDFYKTNSEYKKGSTTEFSIVSQTKGTDGTVTSSIPEGSKPLTLGAGTYWIRESKAPDGYNKLDDLKVVIDAKGNITMDNPATVNPSQSSGTDNITVTAKAGDQNAAVSSTGLITFNIINKSGALLPSTGGIGTTIFYIVGGVVIAAAVVLLVVRKKRE